MLAAWPVLSFAALLVYQQSMGRARIRNAHVLRCVVYSGDVMVWAAVAMLLLSLMISLYATVTSLRETQVMLTIALVAYFTACYRLVRAYKLYLRFHRPLLTVFAAQVMVVLIYLFVATHLPR